MHRSWRSRSFYVDDRKHIIKRNRQRKKITEPNEIFQQINNRLSFTLLQGGMENSAHEDGMEIALIRYNKKLNQIIFAGAGQCILIANKQSMRLIEGDQTSVGGIFLQNPDIQFKQHKILIDEETVIYCFSDGFKDQFGGPKNRKFGLKQFLDLLEEISNEPLNIQENLLLEKFGQWKGNQKQVDDVMVIGLKFYAKNE